MYVHSIPTNGDNQDVVSMGTNAALLTKKVIENTFEVISIHLIGLIQSVEYLKYQDKLSSFTRKIYDDLRQVVPKFVEDDIRYTDIQKIKEFILKNPLDF